MERILKPTKWNILDFSLKVHIEHLIVQNTPWHLEQGEEEKKEEKNLS